jgi:hypothetical protein
MALAAARACPSLRRRTACRCSLPGLHVSASGWAPFPPCAASHAFSCSVPDSIQEVRDSGGCVAKRTGNHETTLLTVSAGVSTRTFVFGSYNGMDVPISKACYTRYRYMGGRTMRSSVSSTHLWDAALPPNSATHSVGNEARNTSKSTLKLRSHPAGRPVALMLFAQALAEISSSECLGQSCSPPVRNSAHS